MSTYQPLQDEALLRRVAELVACGRSDTAELLARLVEVESQQLHLRMGYDSLKAYCIGELHFSEDAARKRVHAAHVASRFPALLDAIADGRLSMTAVQQLSPVLTAANVDLLIDEGTHKTKNEIELLLARLHPRSEALRLDDGVSPQLVVPQRPDSAGCAPERMVPLPEPPKIRTKIAPISAQRFVLQVSIDAEAHEDLRAVQALLGHTIPGSDVGTVIARSLKIARAHLERRKFAKVARPRSAGAASSGRAIPAHVKRAVFERDGDRCAYVGENGHRCGSRVQLEFDHIVPVARGGPSTAANLRMACRVHNQFAADQILGREFMAKKRGSAKDLFLSQDRHVTDQVPSHVHGVPD